MDKKQQELIELQLKQAKSKELTQKIQGVLLIFLFVWIAWVIIF